MVKMSNFSGCFQPSEERVFIIVAGLNVVLGFISLLASCLVIALVVLFKKWQFFTQRLVLYLAISVGLESIAVIIAKIDYNGETSEFYLRFCQFSGFVLDGAERGGFYHCVHFCGCHVFKTNRSL